MEEQQCREKHLFSDLQTIYKRFHTWLFLLWSRDKNAIHVSMNAVLIVTEEMVRGPGEEQTKLSPLTWTWSEEAASKD